MELEVNNIANLIGIAIEKLGEEGDRSEDLIKAKAETAGEYDKGVATVTAELKLKGEPITIIDKQAKGRTADLLIKKIIAEESLKAHYSKLERISAQMNALQSIFRHLEQTTKRENV